MYGAPEWGRLKGPAVGHTFASVHLHVIFSTKHRRPTLEESFLQRLWEYTHEIARKEFGKVLWG